MSFATQAMAAEWVAKGAQLETRSMRCRVEIEEEIAGVKLAAMSIKIDTLDPRAEAVPVKLGIRHLARLRRALDRYLSILTRDQRR